MLRSAIGGCSRLAGVAAMEPIGTSGREAGDPVLYLRRTVDGFARRHFDAGTAIALRLCRGTLLTVLFNTDSASCEDGAGLSGS